MPHDKYNIRGIAHARTNRKDDIFMQRRLYIDEAHTALDIFRFAVFFQSKLHLRMDFDSGVGPTWYIIDSATEIFFLNHKQRGTFCPLALPSHQPHLCFVLIVFNLQTVEPYFGCLRFLGCHHL